MRRAPSAHQAGLVWQVNNLLDVEAMQEAANFLIGNHDFTTFRSSICQAASPQKTLDELRVEHVDTLYGPEVHFHVRARSFLHNQVRSFVGTLERVGSGGWVPQDVQDALRATERSACGPVCPPQGLYLAGVTYPDAPFP
jgi:tRNA pseudouridine38-40 synthase